MQYPRALAIAVSFVLACSSPDEAPLDVADGPEDVEEIAEDVGVEIAEAVGEETAEDIGEETAEEVVENVEVAEEIDVEEVLEEVEDEVEAVVCGCPEEDCETPTIGLGETVACTLKNPLGTCTGLRECTEDGLTPCDAAIPAEDVCDGVDNDCDGDTDDLECVQDNPCAVAACVEGACVETPSSDGPCDDGDACTGEGTCDNGQCIAVALDCDDEDLCTADTCVPGVGCLNVDSGLCTCQIDEDCPPPEDRCLGDVYCVATEDKPWLHCVQDPTTAVVCELPPGASPECQEPDCDPQTGECFETPINEGEPCVGDDLCEEGAACLDGVCAGGTPIACDDEDACNGVEGCEAGVCQVGATCDPEFGCLPGNDVICDDGEPCTNDFCLPNLGCVSEPTTEDCCPFGVSDEGYCLPELVADAGPDVLVEPATEVTLLGAATGGDGDHAFQWSKSSGPLGATAEQVVNPLQSTTYTLTVTDGVGNVATDTVTVQVLGVPLSLCDWPPLLFDPDGQTQPDAVWVFDEACTQATQTKNAKPSVLLSDVDFEGGTLTGAFHVDTTDDDDLIGFVFGYQGPGDFYLVDWKQGQQTFCGVEVFAGLSIKHVTGPGPLVCADFFDSLGTGAVDVLVTATPPGWKDFVTYQWTLKLEGQTATVTLAEGEQVLHEVTTTLESFDGGLFGFYNNSQDSVVYEFFEFVE